MIHYLKPARRRHRRASLSLPPRRATAAALTACAVGLALSRVVTPPAREALAGLLEAWPSAPLMEWLTPQALSASVFIAVFFGCTTLLGLGLGAVLKAILRRERLRLETASALDAGPGLRGHPRLEP